MSRADGWYNGFSWPERIEKLRVWNGLIAGGKLPRANGPCGICGDPESAVEYHSEDYSKPYRWAPPAAYALCRYCHRNQLHMRFWQSDLWTAYLAHVRRGGYGSDLGYTTIRKEFEAYRRAIKRGKARSLFRLRPYGKIVGAEWFAGLTMNVESLRDPAARPR